MRENFISVGKEVVEEEIGKAHRSFLHFWAVKD